MGATSLQISRRSFLLAAGGGVLALGRRASGASLLERGASPQQLETPLETFDRLHTPNDLFFVRSHFGPPALRPDRALRITGLVGTSLSLTPDELRAMPSTTVTAVVICAGAGRSLYEPRVPGVQWGHGAMGQAEWRGVRLADLLGKAGVAEEARQVGLRGADLPPLPTTPPFYRSLPIARALDPTTLVAYEMNGEPIPLSHGGPLRLVVPGWAADNWTKWLAELDLRKDEAPGFYMQKAYRVPDPPVAPGEPAARTHPAHEFPVKSVIARPADGARVARGRNEVVGVALSGFGGIERVEVSADDGATWTAAKLEGEPSLGRWQVFRASLDLTERGAAAVLARATDAAGNVQPRTPTWNPGGYFWNGWHRVSLEVT
ncbi:MAG: sulfite oxidase [Myxococcota bacterium]|nr:sulfite oxidase [Myxococcota bacterium]